MILAVLMTFYVYIGNINGQELLFYMCLLPVNWAFVLAEHGWALESLNDRYLMDFTSCLRVTQNIKLSSFSLQSTVISVHVYQ